MISREFYAVSIAFIGILGFALGVLWQQDAQHTYSEEESEHEPVIAQSGEFTMTAEYIEDDTWEYQVTGSFDNQCPKYDISTELIDAKTEIVKVRMMVYKPADDVLCAQAIKQVKESGEFTAAADSEIEFTVQESESRPTVTGLPALED
jgi:hypothetical protein